MNSNSQFSQMKETPTAEWVPLQSMSPVSGPVHQQYYAPQHQNLPQNASAYQQTYLSPSGQQQQVIIPFSGPSSSNSNVYQVLQQRYSGYFHYAIANIIFLFLAIISCAVKIFSTLLLDDGDVICDEMYSSWELRQRCREDPGNFFNDRETHRFFMGLLVLYFLISKGILVVIYYVGKYAYDAKNITALKVLLGVYCWFFVCDFWSWSLFGVIVDLYLIACAWRIKETLESMALINPSEMRT